MTFAGRVVAGTLLVLVVSVLVLLWIADVALRRDLESEVSATLRRQAHVVREGLPSDPVAAQQSIHRIAEETGYRITLIAPDGTVTGESDYDELPLPAIENHAARPEVRRALSGGTGMAKRRSETVGRELMYVAIPGGPGVVRIAANLQQVDGIVHSAQLAVALAALVALAVGGLVAWLTAGSVTRPLTAITEAARTIAAGQAPRFPHSGIRDIDALVQALRQMHHDLADRFEALRHEQAESAALVASMVEGVVAADARGRILTANPAARRVLGYGPEAPLPDLQQLFRARSAREIVRLVGEGTPVEGEEVGIDGRLVMVSARPLPNGGAILVLHDQTEVRRLEAVRRDFVANVSHELKTPLTSISGYAETLLAERPEEAVERQFLQTILANSQRMQRLVDDLLDLSRIESGRWQPALAAIDVEELATEAWSDFSARAGGQGSDLPRSGRARGPDAAGGPGGCATGACATSSTTRCATPRLAASSRCGARPRKTGSRSRYPTPGAGFPRSTCRGSSSGSTGSIPRAPVRRGAPGSAWPSSGTPSRRTAAGWGSKASSGRAPR